MFYRVKGGLGGDLSYNGLASRCESYPKAARKLPNPYGYFKRFDVFKPYIPPASCDAWYWLMHMAVQQAQQAFYDGRLWPDTVRHSPPFLSVSCAVTFDHGSRMPSRPGYKHEWNILGKKESTSSCLKGRQNFAEASSPCIWLRLRKPDTKVVKSSNSLAVNSAATYLGHAVYPHVSGTRKFTRRWQTCNRSFA